MRLDIWINAFIPDKHGSYIQTLTGGQHNGKTAISLPSMGLTTNPEKIGTSPGYLSDQRGFSNKPNASVRMQSWVSLIVSRGGRVAQARAGHRTSGTTEVDMQTGEQLGYANADMSRCNWSHLEVMPAVRYGQGGTYRAGPLSPPIRPPTYTSEPPHNKMKVHGQAGDPLVRGAADIDYWGTFTIIVDRARSWCVVEFDGMIDEFPAFECYARIGHDTQTLFRKKPAKGKTVTAILGLAPVKMTKWVKFTGLSRLTAPRVPVRPRT